MEMLEEVKLVGCSVQSRQLNELMLAVPTSIKRLDLSNNPGILGDLDMPSWHHVEMLEEMKLVGCSVQSRQLNELMLAVPTSMKRLDLSNNPGILGDLDMPSWHHVEMLEEIKLVGCSVQSRQLNELMLAVPMSTKRLDLSNNPRILGNLDMPSWHHVEMLEEMKLVGCSVQSRQLNELMLAVPTSMKRLDLSNNPGILGDLDMPSWHHVEMLEEMQLVGSNVNAEQLDKFIAAVPLSVATITLDSSPEFTDVLSSFGFSKDGTVSGRWCRQVARPGATCDGTLRSKTRGYCVVC